MLDWLTRPHRRLNPLTGEWLLVSPQRALRPWQGERESVEPQRVTRYDPSCYLCPGNERAGGIRNPPYTSTFVFDNDFPALVAEAQSGSLDEKRLLVAEAERGICRVMCFSPRHDLSIPSMEISELVEVVETWRGESIRLRNLPFINSVQIFENRGLMMGASNPHPHCQIWATEHTPNELVNEDRMQDRYSAEHGTCLLCSYLALEQQGERRICENDAYAAFVPFWAVWPFEVIVLSKRHCDRLEYTTNSERGQLGAILRNVTRRFDRLFDSPFPYSMGFHERSVDAQGAADAWHLHAHFYPPLLRSATVRKFMVGFELLAGPQRDITAEDAAKQLREAEPELQRS